MSQSAERVWDFDAVQVGQSRPPVSVKVTLEDISRYARAVRNPNPVYHDPAAAARAGYRAVPAPPTMAFVYAPSMRRAIAAHHGFIPLELAPVDPRQTPFAKCRITWYAPVHAGDTIISTTRVVDKYQRRGSKFVTLRTEAVDREGQAVLEYDYTCIFQYAQGQRPSEGQAPSGPAEGGEVSAPARPGRVDAASLEAGDPLPAFTITETQETINAYAAVSLVEERNPRNIHTDAQFARRNIFGGTVNAGVATMAYVCQMLEQCFPLSAFYNGGILELKATRPIRPGDTVTFSGQVTARRGVGELAVLECQVTGSNQRGELVAVSSATLVLGK